MDRTACVDLPAFPLQLLLQDHPDWQDSPAAVVDRDHPQGILLWVNEHARRFRVLPGMRYNAGLSLSAQLRAAEVSPQRIDKAVSQIARRLRRFDGAYVSRCDAKNIAATIDPPNIAVELR